MKLVENRKEMPGYDDCLPAYGTTGCDDMPFCINRTGNWLYKGGLIKRKAVVCLFASMLTRDENGRYFLESPAGQKEITVEDAPFVVVDMKWRGVGRKQELCFLTNTDECIVAGQEHGLRMAQMLPHMEYVPYLHVRNGRGNFPIEARVGRAIYYELVALAEPGIMDGHAVMGVWSGGVFFPVGVPSSTSAPMI